MDEPTQPMDGARILAGRYRLVERIGRGGMATVFRATDDLLGRDVAVKILDLEAPTKDPAAAERFRREARTTASLSHDNIVTVFDTGLTDDHAFIVMELLAGQTLADEVKSRGALPADEVAAIGAQVASALAAAHARGILHRDIKPGNIARTADGRIKVLDFGITRLVDEAQDPHGPLTATQNIIGTAQYLSPEQASGQPADRRSDLYALGCLLFTLLTGHPPFRGETPVATLMQHATAPIPNLASERPDAPADLVALVTQLMAKDPDVRPQPAEAVASRLRGAGGSGDAATVPLGGPVAGGAARTRVLGPGAAGAATGAGALGGAAAGASTGRTAAAAPPPANYSTATTQVPRERRGSALPWLLLLAVLALGGVGAYALMNGWDPLNAVVASPSPSAPVEETAEETVPETTAEETASEETTPETTEQETPSEEPAPSEETPIAAEPTQLETDKPVETAPPVEEPAQEQPVPDGPALDAAESAVAEASSTMGDAVQDAFTEGTFGNDERQRLQQGLRELDQALREGNDQIASDGLSKVDQALSDSDRKDDFEDLYETLKDAVDDWKKTLGD